MRRTLPLVVATVAVVLVAACGGGDGPPSTTSTTRARVTTTTTTTMSAAPPTTAPAPTSAAPASTTTAFTAAPATAAAPPAACPPIPARAEPRADRPRYRLRVDVRPADNVAEGQVDVQFTPDLATDRLVFRLWANGPRPAGGGARLDVGAPTVDGRPVDARVDEATTLVLRTGSELAAGRPVDVSVPWRLTLPRAINDRISRSGDAVRLGSFFPILAWEPGVGWAVDPPTAGFAEASMAAAADFDARISVPAGFDVLATGTPDGSGRWTASAVPDFALTVGHFRTATATINVPQAVQVTVGVQAGIDEAPEAYLGRVTGALTDLSRRFGPYPWPMYTLAVTPTLSGGIEYPMHVFQGPGTSTRTTPHEVAHMWFYGLVENNQGRDPWMDEGLATYAEGRVENTLGSFVARSIPAAGRGRVGEPMRFWETRQSIYYRSVYVQGAQAVAALGSADLVDCALRVYVARNAYRVARPGDLVDAARAVFPNAAEVLARYGVR